GAVEHQVFGLFGQQLVERELGFAWGAVLLRSVQFALHDVELAVDFRQAAFRFDQDHAVHAVGDVLRHHRGCAVVHVQARVQGLESEALGAAGSRLGHRSAAARTRHGMEVDRVDHVAVLGVGHVDVHGVAYAYADERTWNLAIEGPVFVCGAVHQLAQHFSRFQLHVHGLRAALADRGTDFHWVARNVGALRSGFDFAFADDDLADHAGGHVARQGADVSELALFVSLEDDGGRCALVLQLVRLDVEVRYGDIVGC